MLDICQLYQKKVSRSGLICPLPHRSTGTMNIAQVSFPQEAPALADPAEDSGFGWPAVALLAVVGAVVSAALPRRGVAAVPEADVESARIAALAVQALEGSFSG